MKREVESINFGRWMKKKRKEMKLTQERFASIIMSNQNTVSRYETGDKFPPLDVVEQIVTALGAQLVIKEEME